MIRALIKTGLAHGLRLAGAGLRGRLRTGGAERSLVVGYHRVVEDYERSARRAIPAMLVSRGMLERQLDWIGARYRFVDLDDLPSGVQRGRSVAAVTFDDGYRDVYEQAFPLLMRKGIPFAVFVITDLVSTDRLPAADRLHLLLAEALGAWPSAAERLARLLGDPDTGALPAARVLRLPAAGPVRLMRLLLESLRQERLLRVIAALEARVTIPEEARREHRMLTWEMLGEMRRAGVVVGSHTRTHPLLALEGRERAVEETAGSRRLLERRLEGPVRHFAYPDGSFDAATIGAVAAAGYAGAYTTCRHRDAGRPRLTIPRALLWERSGLDAFGRFSPALMECVTDGTFGRRAGCRLEHAT